MKKVCLKIVLCFFFYAVYTQSIPINYQESVENWWQAHPYNPESANYEPHIISPSNSITVSSGTNLQNIIDTLTVPATIYLASGTYEGFEVFGKSNIHFVGLGDNVVISNKSCHIAPMELAQDYGGYLDCLALQNPDCHFAFNNPPKNFYFKNITFDGGGILEIGLWLNRVFDVMIEDCVFQNYVDPLSNHLGLISGRMGSRNVWIRGCELFGSQRYALYLDGCHGCGVMDSYLDEHFGSGGILYLTNDDFSRDYNNNEIPDHEEQMTAQYNIIYNNIFEGWIPTAVSIMGRECLVSKNTVLHEVNTFVVLNSKASHVWEGLEYEYFGNKVWENILQDRAILEFAHINKFQYNSPPLGNEIFVGQNEIRCNVIEGTGDLITETGDPLDAPNLIAGNCSNDPNCEPCQITSTEETGLFSNILVYPNPASNHLYIQLKQAIFKGQISLIDLDGKIRSHHFFNGSDVELPLYTLPSGIFFLKIQGNKFFHHEKIIIQ